MTRDDSTKAGERTQREPRSAFTDRDAVVYIGSDSCGHRFNIFGCEFSIPFIGLMLRSFGGTKWPCDLPDFFESNREGRCTKLTDYGAAHCDRVFRQAETVAQNELEGVTSEILLLRWEHRIDELENRVNRTDAHENQALGTQACVDDLREVISGTSEQHEAEEQEIEEHLRDNGNIEE